MREAETAPLTDQRFSGLFSASPPFPLSKERLIKRFADEFPRSLMPVVGFPPFLLGFLSFFLFKES